MGQKQTPPHQKKKKKERKKETVKEWKEGRSLYRQIEINWSNL